MATRDGKQPDFFSRQVLAARRFFLDLDPAPDEPLTVVSGGCEHCAADYRIERDGFYHPTIEYVARGSGTVRLRGDLHPLAPGTLFTYGPGIAHVIRTDPDDRLVKYFVDFTGTRAQGLLAETGFEPGTLRRLSAPRPVQDIFDGLVRDGLRGTRHAPRLCALGVEQLVLTAADGAVPPDAGSQRAFATYQKCCQFIDAHYLDLASAREIASACHINLSHLCRLFQRFDHRSPYQHLLRKKMGHAAERLSSAPLLVKEVASELGFRDPYHFSRVFKKVHGLSPERFLKVDGRSHGRVKSQ
jgi:AraC-like DNA-binding protein